MHPLIQRFYGRRANWKDGTSIFRECIGNVVCSNSRVLDLGAGSGSADVGPTGRGVRVIGVDVDGALGKNTSVDWRVFADAASLPFKSESFDIVFANYVVEHLPLPETALHEVARVLRSRGYFIFRTPNRWHYVTLAGSLLPHWAHELLANRARGRVNDRHTVFPTFYRMNTAARVRSSCSRAGFDSVDILMLEREPSYLVFSSVAFALGVAYERLVNMSDALQMFRSNLVVTCRKA